MRILVCIKQVPESNKVEVDPVTGVLKRDGAAAKMNPYDIYALETAFKIREEKGGSVHVISMGPSQSKQVIREAFAMGADSGTLLSDRKFGGADVLATSYTLAQGIKACGRFDLILCGKQTTDGDTAQVGPEISEWLGIPGVADVVSIDQVDADSITVSMDLPSENEVAQISFPCLLSVDQYIYFSRFASYLNQIDAIERDIQVLALSYKQDQVETHYGLNRSPTQVQKIFPAEVNDKKEVWQDAGEVLADKLFDKL